MPKAVNRVMQGRVLPTHRTVRAFSMVSAVVNVLDTTTTKVVSGLRPLRARATSTGSTLARKRRFLPRACRPRQLRSNQGQRQAAVAMQQWMRQDVGAAEKFVRCRLQTASVASIVHRCSVQTTEHLAKVRPNLFSCCLLRAQRCVDEERP